VPRARARAARRPRRGAGAPAAAARPRPRGVGRRADAPPPRPRRLPRPRRAPPGGRGAPRAVMVGGTGVVLASESVVREADLFVAVDVERTGGPEARVRVASAIEPAWLAELFPGSVTESTELVFDATAARIVARCPQAVPRPRLAETTRTDVDRTAAGEILAEVVRRDPRSLLGDAEKALLARLAFLARAMPELGLPGDPDALAAEARAGLAAGRTALAEVGSRRCARGDHWAALGSPARGARARGAGDARATERPARDGALPTERPPVVGRAHPGGLRPPRDAAPRRRPRAARRRAPRPERPTRPGDGRTSRASGGLRTPRCGSSSAAAIRSTTGRGSADGEAERAAPDGGYVAPSRLPKNSLPRVFRLCLLRIQRT
jgi:hypothetical protein